MRPHKRGVLQIAGLVAPKKPAAVGGVGFDDPKVGVVFCNVAIGIDAPLFIGAANPVYFNIFFN